MCQKPGRRNGNAKNVAADVSSYRYVRNHPCEHQSGILIGRPICRGSYQAIAANETVCCNELLRREAPAADDDCKEAI